VSFFATYFGSSTWLIELHGFRILVDPWLTEDLFFSPPGPWLINGRLDREFTPPDNIDLLLLTQGLADHSHPPSLRLLDRSTPAIASPSACKVLEQLDFVNINLLQPGKSIDIGPLFVQATAGARVPILENGYIVSNKEYSFYIEPHGFLDQTIPAHKLSAVISPVVNLKLPLAGSFIKGKSTLPKLIELFNPNIVLASTTGGDATFNGVLNNLISVDGSIEEATIFLEGKSEFINPLVDMAYDLTKYVN